MFSLLDQLNSLSTPRARPRLTGPATIRGKDADKLILDALKEHPGCTLDELAGWLPQLRWLHVRDRLYYACCAEEVTSTREHYHDKARYWIAGTQPEVQKRVRAESQRRALEFLQKNGPSTALAVAEGCGFKSSDVSSKVLSRLAKAGHVQVAKTGHRYLYSLTVK